MLYVSVDAGGAHFRSTDLATGLAVHTLVTVTVVLGILTVRTA